MSSSSPFRAVHFEDPSAFIEATKEHDDSFMNFAIGALLDNLDPRQAASQAHWGGGLKTLMGVYRDHDLLVTVTKIAKDFSWIISAPRGAHLEDHEISLAIRPLVSLFSTKVDPKTFDKLLGPTKYVNAFLDAWVTHMHETGTLSLKLLDPYFLSKVCYAVRATLPKPTPEFSIHKVSVAGDEDVESLASLYVEFTSTGPNAGTMEEGRAVMSTAVQFKSIWICRATLPNTESTGDVVAGYVLMGRFTPRTVAIKNVFVSPAFRKRGIAETMVRAVTRYYLGATPLGFEGAPEGGPDGGIKEEVCLNVATPDAERLYLRTGFLVEKQDPATGKEGWYPSCWRGVEQIPKT
ncbi:hypothetical protein EIP91_000841 [Steccherinum ochraceum]|uniref:N-acetyltransferase domain-containing protein n=1 Tax=Steccherinum ochraceum TaxID=92696 RepID=A0A4R0RVY3_9APHY|nr:hypothetical protein EIP91_000841 [Steccherinum ochraceum]